MKRNKGFTLIELIVVVALLAIAATVVSSSVSSIYSMDIKQCVKHIDTALTRCQVGVMSRQGDVYLAVTKESDGIYTNYYENDTLVERERAGKPTIVLKATCSDGSEVTLDSTAALYFSFIRTTGSMMSMDAAKSLAEDFVPTKEVFCEKLTAISDSGGLCVRMVPVTGKHYVEKAGD